MEVIILINFQNRGHSANYGENQRRADEALSSLLLLAVDCDRHTYNLVSRRVQLS